MKLIQNRRGAVMTIAATAAVCSLGLLWHILAVPQQDTSHPVQVSSFNTIPFDPPVVHPGYGSQMEAFKREHLRSARNTATSNLLFQNEDRKAFKALHPFLLDEPELLSAQKPDALGSK